MITAGASEFLPKDSWPTEIIHAIRTVHTGEALIADLAPRERDTLRLIRLGNSNCEIGNELSFEQTL